MGVSLIAAEKYLIGCRIGEICLLGSYAAEGGISGCSLAALLPQSFHEPGDMEGHDGIQELLVVDDTGTVDVELLALKADSAGADEWCIIMLDGLAMTGNADRPVMHSVATCVVSLARRMTMSSLPRSPSAGILAEPLTPRADLRDVARDRLLIDAIRFGRRQNR